MKKTILAFAIILSISISTNAQSSSKKEKKETQKTELKAHVCTSACQNGEHKFAHGEKGHVCSAACKTTPSKEVNLKSHGLYKCL